jgi:hypothetical protein
VGFLYYLNEPKSSWEVSHRQGWFGQIGKVFVAEDGITRLLEAKLPRVASIGSLQVGVKFRY